MKSKQVLLIEQMKLLQELGVDTSDASMVYEYIEDKNSKEIRSEPVLYVNGYKNTWECSSLKAVHIPTFTLQDVLDKLPKIIKIGAYSYNFCAESLNGYWITYYRGASIKIFNSEENEILIDAAYNMLCWCAERGYLKKKVYDEKRTVGF